MPYPKTSLMKTSKDFKTLRDTVYGPNSGANAATPNGTGVSISGGVGSQKTVITFVNTPLPLIDTPATVARCALKVLDLPEGDILIQSAVLNLVLTKSAAGVNADWDGDVGVGTAAAAADATLSGTEQNIIPTTPTPQAVAGVTTAKGRSTAQVILDGTTTAVDVYLNVLVDDADQDATTTPTNLIANGTLTIIWASAGDY